jgi:hypothetical protein
MILRDRRELLDPSKSGRDPVRVKFCHISKHVNESFILNFLDKKADFFNYN